MATGSKYEANKNEEESNEGKLRGTRIGVGVRVT